MLTRRTLHNKQRHHQVQEQDATLLDMGCYLYCPKGTELPMILSPHLLDESSGLFRPQRQRMSSHGQQQQQQQQLLLRALHLYQLLAPSMVARGCYFGSRLSLKPEWRQLDRDFYQAPGDSMGRMGRRSRCSWVGASEPRTLRISMAK